MRMRTIDEAAQYIQKVDPETALTPTAIRRLVTTGQLPSVKIGQKYLLALETLDDFLAGRLERPALLQNAEQPGKIRRLL